MGQQVLACWPYLSQTIISVPFMSEAIINSPLPAVWKPPGAKALKLMPDLQREAELDELANQINCAHTQIEDHSKTVLDAGTAAIERAIACGNWLRTVKATLKHGYFEDWCAKHLKFKMRKAQYYMLLADRYTTKDIRNLNPQSLRQALIYAGALPVDADKKHRPAKFDDWAGLRKAVSRLLSQLRANDGCDPEQLLSETEPILRWRDQLVARLSGTEKPAVIVDITAEVSANTELPVEPQATSKAQHDAFLPAGSEEPDDFQSVKSIRAMGGSLEEQKPQHELEDWPEERHIEIVKAVKAIKHGKPTLAEIGEQWQLAKSSVCRIYQQYKHWNPCLPFKAGEKIRFKGRDYEVVEPGVFNGKVRDLKTNGESTIAWRVKGHMAVKR